MNTEQACGIAPLVVTVDGTSFRLGCPPTTSLFVYLFIYFLWNWKNSHSGDLTFCGCG